MPKKYLSEKQEADRLNLPPRRLRELRLDRLVPFIRLGRKTIIYDPDATDKALAKLERKVGA